MCGIVGYVGAQDAAPILIKGLSRLEYRGYDSAGLAIVTPRKNVKVVKKLGKVATLAQFAAGTDVSGNVGIGHTRWATHGEPSDVNAHPHASLEDRFAIVHNGIIENYVALRTQLQQQGYVFKSQTDTEVIVHLIDSIQRSTQLAMVPAVLQALSQLVGTYGIALVSADEPDTIIAARKGSPLILGVGENEYLLASDASAVIDHTRNVVYLNDGEAVVIRPTGYQVFNLNEVPLEKEVHQLEWDLGVIEKGGYDHFMLKEIMEQPDAMENCLRGRLVSASKEIKLGGLLPHADELRKAERIIICACGTSWHAALTGEYLIEQFARIPVEVEYASEFRYRDPILRPTDLVFVISQSGETADTLAAMRLAKDKGVPVFGIVNAVGSTIAREAGAGVYLHAGPEIGVASTKAFSAQVTVLTMVAMLLAKGRTITDAELLDLMDELSMIPDKMRDVLAQHEQIREIARMYRYASNFLYLGRGYNFPLALEGALKLKEISYIHAEGYPAAEMKHGPIALIDQFMPVVFIAPRDATYEKVVSNIEEVVARKGIVIAITDEGNTELESLCEHVIYIPSVPAHLVPLIAVVPLQLLSYYIAVMRGCNVDQPRNLAKSVTVE
jgi:glucosamine--fructose-6-phosphate aminotransferase (isomerizing)